MNSARAARSTMPSRWRVMNSAMDTLTIAPNTNGGTVTDRLTSAPDFSCVPRSSPVT